MNLPIVLNEELPIPLHQQLTSSLREAIATQRLMPGEAMPEVVPDLGPPRESV